jgi:hypothetical protein
MPKGKITHIVPFQNGLIICIDAYYLYHATTDISGQWQYFYIGSPIDG